MLRTLTGFPFSKDMDEQFLERRRGNVSYGGKGLVDIVNVADSFIEIAKYKFALFARAALGASILATV